jgi:hypothetical protein
MGENKTKVYLAVASVRLPPGMIKEVAKIAKVEGKTRSAMINYLVEIGFATYTAREAGKDLADIRMKLKEIQEIIER